MVVASDAITTPQITPRIVLVGPRIVPYLCSYCDREDLNMKTFRLPQRVTGDVDNLQELSDRFNALRDVVIILLAREAERASNPAAFLEAVSDATDHRAHEFETTNILAPDKMRSLEAIRAETDLLVSFARDLMARP
jgi:hypothetical protein